MATTLAAPLLNRTGVAHTHVPAHVEHAVDAALVADGALAWLAGERRLQAFAPLLQVRRRRVRPVCQGALETLVGDRIDVRGGAGTDHGAGQWRRGLSRRTGMWYWRGSGRSRGEMHRLRRRIPMRRRRIDRLRCGRWWRRVTGLWWQIDDEYGATAHSRLKLHHLGES